MRSLAFELRAGADEIEMMALEHAKGFRVEAEAGARLMERIDAAEEGRVQIDLVPVLGDDGRHVALDLLQRVVGMRRGQVEHHELDARQRATGILERRNRVREGRRLGIPRDQRDLLFVPGQRAVVSRAEMLRRDAVERRGLEGGGPGLEERVAGHCGGPEEGCDLHLI